MSNIKDLLSEQFQQYTEKMFSDDDIRCKAVFTITQAYYVYTDLKAGFEFSQIQKFRLKIFEVFLHAYLVHNNNDVNICKLYIILVEYLKV